MKPLQERTLTRKVLLSAAGAGAAGMAVLGASRTDPHQTRDLAGDFPEIVEKIYEEYALEDVGGSLSPY